MKPVEIIPAILPRDFADLKERVERAAPFVKFVQVDVSDGKLIPSSKTWPYQADKDVFASIIKEERGLPEWERVDYEIDVMVKNPERDVEDWILAGAKRLVLHLESEGDISSLLKSVKQKYGGSESALSVEVGVALPPGESIEKLDLFLAESNADSSVEALAKADFVQLMGISKIGFQGNPFREEVLGEVRALREKYPGLIIAIDGSVNDETAPLLIEAGANRLISGSYLFQATDFEEALRALRRT